MKTPVAGGAGRRSSAFVDKDSELALHAAPKQQHVAESSIGDGAEAEGAGPSNRSVRGSTVPTTRLAQASPRFA
jgi:hypothetical protein